MNLVVDNSWSMAVGSKEEMDKLDLAYTIWRKDRFFATHWSKHRREPVRLLRGALIPTGLLPEIVEKFAPTVEDKRRPPQIASWPSREDSPQLYPFQVDVVNQYFALKDPRVIIDAPTNAGKTLIAGEIIRRLGLDTLYLIQSKSALTQIKKKLERMLTVPVGICGGGFKEDGQIVLSTFSSADKLNLRQFKVVIVDECHHAPAETYEAILQSCTEAYFRIGLTGTSEGRSDGLEKLMDAALSTNRIAIPREEVRKYGLRPEIRVGIIDVEMPFNALGEHGYEPYIVNNDTLNQLIANLALRYSSQDKGVLIYCERLEHCANLYKLLPTAIVLDGDSSTEQRDYVMQNAKGKIILGTRVVSESLDAPDVEVVINAAANKSSITLTQLLGRSLRGGNNKVVLVFDFMHRDGATFERRSHKRRRVWKDNADLIGTIDINTVKAHE